MTTFSRRTILQSVILRALTDIYLNIMEIRLLRITVRRFRDIQRQLSTFFSGKSVTHCSSNLLAPRWLASSASTFGYRRTKRPISSAGRWTTFAWFGATALSSSERLPVSSSPRFDRLPHRAARRRRFGIGSLRDCPFFFTDCRREPRFGRRSTRIACRRDSYAA